MGSPQSQVFGAVAFIALFLQIFHRSFKSVDRSLGLIYDNALVHVEVWDHIQLGVMQVRAEENVALVTLSETLVVDTDSFLR
jgi:hypothetical protein